MLRWPPGCRCCLHKHLQTPPLLGCTTSLSSTAPPHPCCLQTCQDKLEALKRDQAAIRRGQYASTSCPICLEDFADEETPAGRNAAGSGSNGASTSAGPADGGLGGSSAAEVRQRKVRNRWMFLNCLLG